MNISKNAVFNEIIHLHGKGVSHVDIAKELKSKYSEISIGHEVLRKFVSGFLQIADLNADNSNIFKSIKESKGFLTYELKGDHNIASLDELIEYFEIDTNVYEVAGDWIANSWGSNRQVKAKFRKKQELILPPKDYELLKDRINKNPFIFKTKKQDHQMWLVLGCIHVPFENKILINAILNLIQDNKKNIHGIILNGDFLDLRSLSEYDKDKVGMDGITLGYEYQKGLELMLKIKKAFGKEYDRIKKVFIYGNHEARYFKHIDKVLNSRYGNALASPTEALRMEELGYQVQPNDKDGYVLLGNSLEVYHGIYYGANPAKDHLTKKPNRSAMFNHSHRVAYHSNGNHEAFNIGWLGDQNSKAFSYSSRFQKQAWQNAFGVVHIDSLGNHYVNTVKCHEKGFFFDGKSY